MSSYEILAISPSAEDTYFAIQERLLALTPEMLSQSDEEEQSHLLAINDGVALIDVSGTLTNRYSYYNRYFGAVSYQEITEATQQAVEKGVGCIVYNYNSPGGSVRGMYDCANMIASLKIPTISFTGSMECSAAYFLGCQSKYSYADAFAEVGSIGVVIKCYDESAYLKKIGIKPERFRSGDLKASGDPDFALTAKEREHIQEQMMTYASKFYNIVSDARGIPLPILESSGITSGKTFIGEQALQVNLVDGMKSFDQVVLKAYGLSKSFIDKNKKSSLVYAR
jgi:signal peptide peptidase SppA